MPPSGSHPRIGARFVDHLGAHYIRIHTDAYPVPLFPAQQRPFSSESPVKIEYFKNPFFATFLLEKLQYGPVAQLGAHYIRIVGVVGSNPIRSTKSRTTAGKTAVVLRLTT